MATQLAAIVADPTIVANTTDVELVSRTRLALRWWCRGMLHDVAPVHHEEVAAKPGLIDLARHPLGVLQRLLSHDPNPVTLGPPMCPSRTSGPPGFGGRERSRHSACSHGRVCPGIRCTRIPREGRHSADPPREKDYQRWATSMTMRDPFPGPSRVKTRNGSRARTPSPMVTWLS